LPKAENFWHVYKEAVATLKTREATESKYPVYNIHNVPHTFWCGHFLNSKKDVIPDGNDCCWWHWIGLPQRYGKRHPCYPWQEQALIDLEEYDYHYTRKPPKVGATQFYLSYALHQSIINPHWVNGQVAIVVGTRGEEAEKMIDRCKEMLSYKDEEGRPIRDDEGILLTRLPINEDYNTKKEFSINSVEFRAHPADNIDSIRSQANMRFILIDEIAFFRMVDQQKVRDAFEHYIGASEVKIVLVTTAGFAPGGVGYEIETEQESIYRKHLYDYNIGLVVHPESMTSLYIKDKIDELRGSISFNRNFLGIWGYGAGNIFDSRTLDIVSGDMYELKDIRGLPNVLSIDPAYGKMRDKLSSKFAGLGLYKENGKIYTRSYFELEEPSDEEGIKRIRDELQRYGYTNLVIDGHWTGIINSFKDMNAYGIVYADHLADMVDTAQKEVSDLNISIHPTHEPLIVQMRSIKKNDKGVPDKKSSRFDLGDCLLQGIWHFIGAKAVGRKLKNPF
jgi:hypothetical protein